MLIGILFGIVLLVSFSQRTVQPATLMAAKFLETDTPTATTAVMPTPTPTHFIFADCLWVGYARAFIDENANLEEDPGEPTLISVTFYVDDTLNNFTKVAKAVSESDDSAELSVWLPGCPEVAFEIYPEIPQGYVLSTPPRLKVPEDGYGDIYFFGFRRIDPTPTTGGVPEMPGTGRLPAQTEQTRLPFPTPTALTIPTPNPFVHEDCAIIIKVQTFLDENGNGQIDARERPLPGVNVYAGHISGRYQLAPMEVTDQSGNATFMVFDPGCVNTETILYVDVPEGYMLTTRQRISSHEEKPYIFGFRSLTPSPDERAFPGMPGTGRPPDEAIP